MGNLSVTTLLAIGIPLLFFALVGLLDLFQKFGYLKSERQRLLEQKITRADKILTKWDENEVFERLELIEKALKKDSLKSTIDECHNMLRQSLNMVTQQTGLITEAKTDLDTLKGISRNVDMAVRKVNVEVPRDLTEQMDYVYKAIKHRSNEAKIERLIEKVEQTLHIVTGHDRHVKDLKDLHPSVRFDQGETPAHWCTARELTSMFGQIHNDIIEAVKGMRGAIDGIGSSLRGERGIELDHLLKILTLLGTLLGRVESLQDKYQELYDLLSSGA